MKKIKIISKTFIAVFFYHLFKLQLVKSDEQSLILSKGKKKN